MITINMSIATMTSTATSNTGSCIICDTCTEREREREGGREGGRERESEGERERGRERGREREREREGGREGERVRRRRNKHIIETIKVAVEQFLLLVSCYHSYLSFLSWSRIIEYVINSPCLRNNHCKTQPVT